MKQKEIIEELNRLKGEIDRLEKELNKPKDEIIYVPKGILRDKYNEIINGKKTLRYDEHDWGVYTPPIIPESTEKQCKLVPCERKDLKAGDVAFCYRKDGESDIEYLKEHLFNYCIVIENGIVSWDEMGVSVYTSLENCIWYKVLDA